MKKKDIKIGCTYYFKNAYGYLEPFKVTRIGEPDRYGYVTVYDDESRNAMFAHELADGSRIKEPDTEVGNWTEEDENFYKSMVSVLNGTSSLTYTEIKRHVDWLKSLKERIKK